MLHVIPSLSASRGGPSFQLPLIAHRLAAKGIVVDIATTDDDGHGRLDVVRRQWVQKSGVKYVYFPRNLRTYTVSLPLARWLWKSVRKYDVVHIHSLFSFPSTAASLAARHHGVPYVLRPLGTLSKWSLENLHPRLKQISIRVIERGALHGAAAVHFTSNQEYSEAAESLEVNHPVVIPNAVVIPERDAESNLTILKEYPDLGDRFVILYLSRLDRKKGLDLLFRAYVEVRARLPRAALVVAGDGVERIRLELHQEARELGIAGDITWTGFVDGARKASLYALADVFVLPSHSENFGSAVVEAMAAGVPVIVTRGVGIWPEIEEHMAGRAIDFAPDELRDALIECAENEVIRRTMGENGRRLARDRFSSESVSTQLATMYSLLTRDKLGRIRHG